MPKKEKVVTQINALGAPSFNELLGKLKNCNAYKTLLYGNDINTLSKEDKIRLEAIVEEYGIKLKSDGDYIIFKMALAKREYAPQN